MMSEEKSSVAVRARNEIMIFRNPYNQVSIIEKHGEAQSMVCVDVLDIETLVTALRRARDEG